MLDVGHSAMLYYPQNVFRSEHVNKEDRTMKRYPTNGGGRIPTLGGGRYPSSVITDKPPCIITGGGGLTIYF